MAASDSRTALRQAIRAYLDDEGESPALRSIANDLRRIEHDLGAAPSRDTDPSPGRLAARAAATTEKTEKPDDAKAKTPGADLDNAARPGTFPGIRRSETAKHLAALRFSSDNKLHTRQGDAQRDQVAQGTATANAKG